MQVVHAEKRGESSAILLKKGRGSEEKMADRHWRRGSALAGKGLFRAARKKGGKPYEEEGAHSPVLRQKKKKKDKSQHQRKNDACFATSEGGGD